MRIGIRDVDKLQGESYRGLSFRSGDSPVEANLNMTGAFQPYEAGRPYREIITELQGVIFKDPMAEAEIDKGRQITRMLFYTQLLVQGLNQRRYSTQDFTTRSIHKMISYGLMMKRTK